MSAPTDSIAAPPPALLEHRSFVAYWCARTATNGAYQMQAVAVGWQIYELTGSAFDLGLVGLVQFFPVVVLGLSDRPHRRPLRPPRRGRHLPGHQGAGRGRLRDRHARRLSHAAT